MSTLADADTRASSATLSRSATLVLAVATGAIAANLYYVQPLLQVIAHALGVGSGVAGLAVTVTQIAFALGLVFVLPAGDIVDRRHLLSGLLVLDAAGLVIVAASGSMAVALIGFAIVGMANVAAQVIVPAAASLASDTDRGRVVGTVISGLLVGMLLARTVSGLVSQYVGWRALFFAAATLMLVLIAVTRVVLPPRDRGASAAPRPGYGAVLRSTLTLYRQQPKLRVRSWFGALGFAAFSLFWSTAAFLLGGPHYHYSAEVIGLFGLLGAAGALVANVTGRLKAHTHPLPTIVAIAVIGASFLIFLAAPGSLAAMVVGIVVLDVGVQGLHVLNQRTIYELDAAARARANSVYMTFYFLGGSVGSAAGVLAWQRAGWTAVCVVGLIIAGLAALTWAFTARTHRLSPAPTAQEI